MNEIKREGNFREKLQKPEASSLERSLKLISRQAKKKQTRHKLPISEMREGPTLLILWTLKSSKGKV